MLVLFVVFYLSAYSSLASGRVSYAGRQIGTTFALAFAGLSRATDIYEPLWRVLGILLGTFVIAIVTSIFWPEYAGDSLLPRLRGVIRDALALVPGGSRANTEDEIQQVDSEAMQLLAEILEVASDAQLEGRATMVDYTAIVEAAGTLRRITNDLSSSPTGRITAPEAPIDAKTESARTAFLETICSQLQSWLGFFDGALCLNSTAALKTARGHSADDLKKALEQFDFLVESREYAKLAPLTLDQRRAVLAELQSMRSLESLMPALNRWLAQVPVRASTSLVKLTSMLVGATNRH